MTPEYYLGQITEVTDPDRYTVKVDVPGVMLGVIAYPDRSTVDEPKVGDVVRLLCLDPVWKSANFWVSLKEDGYNGIRSRGKKLEMKKESVELGIFSPDTPYKEGETPDSTSYLRITEGGDLEVLMEGSGRVKIGKDHKVEVSGSLTVKVSGDTTLESSGSVSIKSGNVTIGGGQVTINGSAAPTGSGAFCAIPVCPFSGAPHVGNKITGT